MILVFLFVLSVPLYGWIAQVVNALASDDFAVSLALRSGRESDFSNVFQVGDTLIVVVESEVAETYELAVYEDASVVLTRRGEFSKAEAVIDVVLSPPVFNAGTAYVVVLDVYAFDEPIPGSYLSDSVSSVFEVVHAPTKVDLKAVYDGTIRNLRLNASLTDVDGYPVANETLDFSLQFVGKQRATEGWVLLGSAVTDNGGTARLSLAFGLQDGNYRVKAFHKGSRNYGASKDTVKVAIFSNVTAGGPGSLAEHGPSVSGSVGDLTLEVSSGTPYALLPMNAWARYTADTALQGDVYLIFYCDYLNSSGVLGATMCDVDTSPPYVYEGSLIWNASVIGSHTIIVGVVNGSLIELVKAVRWGIGLITTAEAPVSIQRCPSNIVLDFPEALYGGDLPITVSVSKPRPYEVQSNDLYVTATLAPSLSYNGVEYVIDDGVGLVPVRLYKNGALASLSSTDARGLVCFQLPLDFTSVTLKVEVDGSSLLSQRIVERALSVGETRVYDRLSVASASFGFNFTVSNPNGQADLFVSVESRVEAEVSLLDHPAWNLSVSVISGRLVSSSRTDAGGGVSIPGGSDYLRVHNLTDLAGDVDQDGEVDIMDMCIVQRAIGSSPGEPDWNVDADLNHDNCVDAFDLNIVGRNYAKVDDRVVFSTGQTVYLDSRGCARIPSGATSLTFMRESAVADAFVEFFKIAFDGSSVTDNLGRAGLAWTPSVIGRYMVQVKLPVKFDLIRTFQDGTLGLDALDNLVRYVDVTKRPVDLSVSYTPAEPTPDTIVTMIANVFDVGLGVPAPGLRVEFYINNTSGNYVLMGPSYTNSSGVATYSWLPRYYVNQLGVSADFVLLVRVVETASTLLAEKAPVHVDARYQTRLKFLTEGEAVTRFVKRSFKLAARLTRADDCFPIAGKYIDFYTNDTKTDWAVTNASGIAVWDLTVSQAGLYYYKAVFQKDDAYFRSSAALDGEITRTYIGDPYYDESYDVYSTLQTARVGYDEDKHLGYQESRMYVSFDTSSIPDTVTIVSACLRVKVASDSSSKDFYIRAYGGTQPIYGSVLDMYDWNAGTALQSSISTSAISVGQYKEWAIQPSQIKRGGITQFRLGAWPLYDNSYVGFYTAERGAADSPVLVVTYGCGVYAPSNEAKVVVVANLIPTTADFDVQPRDFKPGDLITLRATVKNATSGLALQGIDVQFYKVDQSKVQTAIGSVQTDVNGVAQLPNYKYPDYGTYAFLARTPYCRQVATSSGLMLTASTPTTLLLNLDKEASSFKHVISGSLKSGSSGVGGKLIRISVNGTVKATNSTDPAGQFTATLNLEPLNNNPTTYQIQAVFDGDTPTSATAYATVNGTEYAVSTTIRYGNKPASNSTTLIVSPQSTEATTPTKTPEQMQAEAEQSGGLIIWHEFTWSYPWYRLHIKLNLNPTIDIGFNPILPGGEVADWSGLEFFGALIGEILEETLIEATALIGTYLVARTVGIAQPWIGVIMEAGKIGAQTLLFLADWEDALRMLATGLVSIAMSFFAVVNFYFQPNIFMKFVDALWALCGAAQGALRWMLMTLTEMALFGKAVSRSWIDAVEATADYVIGLTALLRYIDLTT